MKKKKWGRYEFQITLAGYGHTPEEAWNDATEGFTMEAGGCPEEYKFEEEDE